MNSFQELNLSPELERAIQELGYEKPSQIQAEALPTLLGEPTDFVGLAATGTGKTAAFAIPLLERIDPSKHAVQGLILCPTRELALQVAGQINLLGKYKGKGIKALPVYGGSSYGDQIHGLKKGATIVVGTPGRVVDHIQRGTLQLGEVHTLILDEADEMISMGFKDDLEAIIAQTPRESSNIWLFSATMSSEVRRVADTYLENPAHVQVNRKEMLPDTIEQLYFKTHESDKPEILCKLIDAADDFYGLVFCQTKALVTDLTQYLKSRGYLVDCLHGDMEQDARERTMKGFRDRRVKLLICTDVASRGLDVKDITHVINYSIPRELDNYVHRIGRTARSGKTGVAMSLVTPSHRGLIARIEKMTKSRMLEGRIPTRRELGAKKVAGVLARFLDQPLHTRAIEVMDASWKEALANMSGEEIAARFLTAMHPEVFGDRNSAPSREPARAAAVAPLTSTCAPVARVGVAPAAVTRVPGVSPVAPLASPVAPAMPAVAAAAPAAEIEESEAEEMGDEAMIEEAAPTTEAAPAASQALPMDDLYVAAGSSPQAAPAAAAKKAPVEAPLMSLEEMALDIGLLSVPTPAGTVAAPLTEKAPKKPRKVSRKAAFVDQTVSDTDGSIKPAVEAAPETERKPTFIKRTKPAVEDRKPAFGDRKPGFSDRKPFGDRKPYGDRKPAFGDRKPYGDRKPAFGDRKPYGDRKPFGDRKPYGKPAFGDRPYAGGGEKKKWVKKEWVKKPYASAPKRDDDFAGSADVGLGRAPQERTSPWKGAKKKSSGFVGKPRAGAGGKPAWGSDKPHRFRRPSGSV